MTISLGAAFRGALRGQTLARIFFNEALRARTQGLRGRALDLASSAKPSYRNILPKDIDLIYSDRAESGDVKAIDMNVPLPFPDASFDGVFLFNALYIVDDPKRLAQEVHRVLKPGGVWLTLSPFVANEMPEPHDYLRFTKEGLERLCRRGGFTEITIERLGERASAATHLMHPFFLFNIVRALVFPVGVLLDKAVSERARTEHPTPLSYFVQCTK